MNDFFKGVGSVGLGALAGAGLAATSFVAIDALMPQPADAAGTCFPYMAVSKYVQLRDAGAPHEAAFQRGVLPYVDGSPYCMTQLKTAFDERMHQRANN